MRKSEILRCHTQEAAPPALAGPPPFGAMMLSCTCRFLSFYMCRVMRAVEGLQESEYNELDEWIRELWEDPTTGTGSVNLYYY
jgi:hypothetical protein